MVSNSTVTAFGARSSLRSSLSSANENASVILHEKFNFPTFIPTSGPSPLPPVLPGPYNISYFGDTNKEIVTQLLNDKYTYTYKDNDGHQKSDGPYIYHPYHVCAGWADTGPNWAFNGKSDFVVVSQTNELLGEIIFGGPATRFNVNQKCVSPSAVQGFLTKALQSYPVYVGNQSSVYDVSFDSSVSDSCLGADAYNAAVQTQYTPERDPSCLLTKSLDNYFVARFSGALGTAANRPVVDAWESQTHHCFHETRVECAVGQAISVAIWLPVAVVVCCLSPYVYKYFKGSTGTVDQSGRTPYFPLASDEKQLYANP